MLHILFPAVVAASGSLDGEAVLHNLRDRIALIVKKQEHDFNMKNKTLLTLMITGVSFLACEKEKIVSEASLPSGASQFITAHFPDEKVLQVKKEKDFLEKTVFDVILSNSFNLEFKENGEAQKVDGNGNAIPVAVIQPKAILTYVEAQFSGKNVVAWEKDSDSKKEIEVGLDNGLELVFDKDGKYLRLED